MRRIVPGVNPDLELPLALAREGCPRVPAPTAWMVADVDPTADPVISQGPADLAGQPYVLGVLQPFVQGASDGWELALRELAKGEDFGAEARALGRATAEVHTALARALPTVTLGHMQLQLMVDGMIEACRRPCRRCPRCGRTPAGCGRRSRRWAIWPPRAAPGPRSACTAICTSGSACARPPASGS
ncbi:hypothetical protein SVIOM74S_00542 [Streptomyces violarus]